jgi:hypothetical protein
MDTTKSTVKMTIPNGHTDELSGDLVLMVSVDLDANDYGGMIGANDRVDDYDHITLMKAVCKQCFENINSFTFKTFAAEVLRDLASTAITEAANEQ